MNGWWAREHRLGFGFAAPGATRTPDGCTPDGCTSDGWERRWVGAGVMGILNATPDSFSDGGRHLDLARATGSARRMVAAGVMLLDIGGESTRPGAEPVPAEEELDRVLPLIRALSGCGALLSIDTMKPEVATEALRAGAHLVNDVSGLRDPEMVRVCAEAGAPACVMHMQGEPRTMQRDPRYGDVVAEVHGFLRAQAGRLREAGVPGVIVDPGLGFGKTAAHNLALLGALPDLTAGSEPVLVGASRKGLIGTLAGEPDPAARDPGSLALHLYAARQGAALLRVHAGAELAQALRVESALARLSPTPPSGPAATPPGAG